METELSVIEAAINNETVASWDRQRSNEELNDFLSRREAWLSNFIA